jgi:hypothetical protein
MSKKLTAEKTPDQVWLAGLGALAVAEQEGNDLFKQLVKKGREAEKVLEKTGPRTKSALLRYSLVRLRASAKEEGLKRFEDSPLYRFLPNAKEKEGIEARQARRLAAARRAFLKEFGSFDKSAVDWERWKRERKIFTVTHRGDTYIPNFQFDENGKLRPVIARAIQILGKETSDWGLALWFTAASGRLDGQRPVDLLNANPDAVVRAAEQKAAELVV